MTQSQVGDVPWSRSHARQVGRPPHQPSWGVPGSWGTAPSLTLLASPRPCAVCRPGRWPWLAGGREERLLKARGARILPGTRLRSPEPSEITGHARGEVNTVISSLRPHSAGQMSKASFWVQGSGGEPGLAPGAHSPPPPTSHKSREGVTGRRWGRWGRRELTGTLRCTGAVLTSESAVSAAKTPPWCSPGATQA